MPRDSVASQIPELAVARLVYVSDAEPGITRHRAGRAFSYRDTDGRIVRDAAILDRIRSLVIPPACTRVWICVRPHGHLQATGVDKRGRKQYRYHPRWREVRDEAKFSRLARIVRTCQELPGHRLFQYVDEAGARHPIGSDDVNAYLKEITGEEFTAKDFRTWAATLLAAGTLGALELPPGKPDLDLAVREMAILKLLDKL